MSQQHGPDWQTTHPNFITSVVSESTGGKPHGRYAMGDSLICNSSKPKKRSRPSSRLAEPSHSFYPSTQVVREQVESNTMWCAGVYRVLQELADKNALDINSFVQPLPPSVDIDELIHSQHPEKASYLPLLNQIEAKSEWRTGVEKMLQVLAKNHSLDFDRLMHPQN